jgi:hypothetical protein
MGSAYSKFHCKINLKSCDFCLESFINVEVCKWIKDKCKTYKQAQMLNLLVKQMNQIPFSISDTTSCVNFHSLCPGLLNQQSFSFFLWKNLPNHIQYCLISKSYICPAFYHISKSQCIQPTHIENYLKLGLRSLWI